MTGRAGKAGLVWRLDTAGDSWAVQVPSGRPDEDEGRSATVFQEAACAAGIPAAHVRRTTGGGVFAMLGGPLRSEECTVISSPVNRTALREEENRPSSASQQVGASPVTGPTPDLTDPQWMHRRWDGTQAYSDSKLFDVVLAFAVAGMRPDVPSNAVEPGWVPTKMGGPTRPTTSRSVRLLSPGWL
jgi:hypothetical protein